MNSSTHEYYKWMNKSIGEQISEWINKINKTNESMKYENVRGRLLMCGEMCECYRDIKKLIAWIID